EDGLTEGANPHALALFKCDYEDLISKPIAGLFHAPRHPQLFEARTLKDGTAEPVEVTALRLNGERCPADILIRPFQVDSAQKALVAVEDVTKRHELEQMKQEFVSMISHDLRDPLTSLQLFLSMTAGGDFDDKLPNLKRRAAVTEKEVDRLIKMIS